MAKFLFSFFFLGSFAVYSQSFSWEGKILEEKTNQPIEYAHVIVHTNGSKLYFISDNKGFVSISYSKSTIKDSIIISHLSYNTVLLNPKELKNKKTLILSTKTLLLNEVEINPVKEENIIIGAKLPTFSLYDVPIFWERKRVVYFPSAMYEKGILEKIEFSFKNSDIFSDKGDTIGRKLPVMLKIYARDTVNNIPGEEILKDTIILFPQKRDEKMQIDISAYEIVLPSEGFYCGFAGFSADWHIAHGYFTYETMSYPTNTKPPINAFHCPRMAVTMNKKDVEMYQMYQIGGHIREWTKVNDSTLAIRLHIRQQKK